MRSLGLFLLLAILAAAPAPAVYETGDTVEDFTLPRPEGGMLSLSDFAGDVILLNFFATW
jgi:hypothetical protein